VGGSIHAEAYFRTSASAADQLTPAVLACGPNGALSGVSRSGRPIKHSDTGVRANRQDTGVLLRMDLIVLRNILVGS
jgi:hypothetical protein